MFPFLLATLLASPTPAPLDARQIYLRARATTNASSIPPYVIFTFQNASADGIPGWHGRSLERLRMAVRTSDGRAFVRTLRFPSGDDGRSEADVVSDDATFTNTNVYRLADFPIDDFGLRKNKTRPGFFDAATSPEPVPSGETLRVIGTVSTIGVPYRLQRLADDTIDGRTVYHLRLTPLRDPGHNVLREMWVDEETFALRRCVAERFVGIVPPFSYLVTVNVDRFADYVLNTSLAGHFTQELSSVPHVVRTGSAAWSISDVSFPSTLPSWLFEPSAFKEHEQEPLPGALAS